MRRESDIYGTTEMQAALLSMLKDFDAFCQQQRISYSLCGGTLLGAVRHKGFIPWDDDADIMVDRAEFAHLLEKLPLFKGYSVHRRLWVYRIQKADATGDTGSIPTIDILVMDHCPDTRILRKCKIFMIWTLQGMMHRQLDLQEHSGFEKFLLIATYLLGKPFSDNFKFRLYDAVSKIGNKKPTKFVTSYNDLFRLIPVRYDSKVMQQIKTAPFEDAMLPITTYYHHYLTMQYGDYMTPPPMEARKPMHDL